MRFDGRCWERPSSSGTSGAWAAVLALACWAGVASADGPRIRWSAPSECPTEAALRERVAATLQRPLESFDASTSFDASVTLTADTYRLVLTTTGRGEQGVRVLVDDDCDALTSAAALAIVFAVRASAVPKATDEAEAAADQSATSASAGPETRSTRRPGLERARRVTPGVPGPRKVASAASRTWLAAEALGHADIGTLPSVSPGAAIGLELGAEPWRLETRAGFLAPVRELDRGRGGLFWLGYVELSGCARVLAGPRAWLAGCALFEVGRLAGTGRGVDERVRGAYPWLAPGARLQSAVRLTRSGTWALAGVTAMIPLIRRWFVLNEQQHVYRPDAAAGRLELGLMQEIW